MVVIPKGSFSCVDPSRLGESHGGNDEPEPYHIQHLLTASSPTGTITQTDAETLECIKASFWDLNRLGQMRWAVPSTNGLPVHIQAVRYIKELELY